jgi:hypothetical protein
MADPELVQTLDYILNRCDEGAIEAVAAAVVRRRRDLTVFGGMGKLPDPQRMARDLSSQLNLEGAIEGVKGSIREMAMRVIREEAPELSDEQAAELTRAWIPAMTQREGPNAENAPRDRLPPDLLGTMIDQFVLYSQGRMDKREDQALRSQFEAWPERYWKAFPPVIRLIINDFLKGGIKEDDFKTKIGAALALG